MGEVAKVFIAEPSLDLFANIASVTSVTPLETRTTWRLVCKAWNQVASTPAFMRRIRAGRVEYEPVYAWLCDNDNEQVFAFNVDQIADWVLKAAESLDWLQIQDLPKDPGHDKSLSYLMGRLTMSWACIPEHMLRLKSMLCSNLPMPMTDLIANLKAQYGPDWSQVVNWDNLSLATEEDLCGGDIVNKGVFLTGGHVGAALMGNREQYDTNPHVFATYCEFQEDGMFQSPQLGRAFFDGDHGSLFQNRHPFQYCFTYADSLLRALFNPIPITACAIYIGDSTCGSYDDGDGDGPEYNRAYWPILFLSHRARLMMVFKKAFHFVKTALAEHPAYGEKVTNVFDEACIIGEDEKWIDREVKAKHPVISARYDYEFPEMAQPLSLDEILRTCFYRAKQDAGLKCARTK